MTDQTAHDVTDEERWRIEMPLIDLIALIIALTIMSTGFLLYIESL